MLHCAGGEHPLHALVTQRDSRPTNSEQEVDFTTDELDVAYFGEAGDPDARTVAAEGSDGDAEEDDGAESEESLALSEAEQLFTVPDFLSSAEELRAHFDDRCVRLLRDVRLSWQAKLCALLGRRSSLHAVCARYRSSTVKVEKQGSDCAQVPGPAVLRWARPLGALRLGLLARSSSGTKSALLCHHLTFAAHDTRC